MATIYGTFLIKRKREALEQAGGDPAVIQCLDELLLEINQHNGDWSGFQEAQERLGANPQVTGFIEETVTHNGEEQTECIRLFFRAGYCWYFAHMLKLAFGRGEVCLAAPFGHFVWVDTDGNPYDIEGLYFGEAKHFIPESYLGDMIDDFKWVPGVAHNTSKEEIEAMIRRYQKDRKE